MRSHRHGVALIAVLIVLALLGLLTATLISLGSQSLFRSHKQDQRQLALFAAEAGLWRAFVALRDDPGFSGYPETDLPSAPARYRVEVIPSPGPGPKGPIPSGLHYIHVVGTAAPVGATQERAQREIGVLVKHTNSAYHYGVFADTYLRLDNASDTDCWDSSQGAYPAGRRVGRAHIGTNGKPYPGTNPSVDIHGGSQVDGGNGNIHLLVGKPPAFIDGPAGAYGERLDQMGEFVMPPVSMDGQSTALGSTNMPPGGPLTNGYLNPGTYGRVTVPAGQTLRLREGAVYYFENLHLDGTLQLGNGSALPVAANPAASRTVVKLSHYLTMGQSGFLENPSGRADYLEFEINADVPGQNYIWGGPEAYFVVKAPRATTYLMGRDMYGAILARDVVLGTNQQCTVHYDLNLENTTASPILPTGTGANNVLLVSYEVY